MYFGAVWKTVKFRRISSFFPIFPQVFKWRLSTETRKIGTQRKSSEFFGRKKLFSTIRQHFTLGLFTRFPHFPKLRKPCTTRRKGTFPQFPQILILNLLFIYLFYISISRARRDSSERANKDAPAKTYDMIKTLITRRGGACSSRERTSHADSPSTTRGDDTV